MKNKKILSLVVAAGIGYLSLSNAAEWNHDKTGFDKNGVVHLKDANGNTWTKNNNSGYKGLSSTSAPTVLNNVVKSQPEALFCFEDTNGNDLVYFQSFGIFSISQPCEAKYTTLATNYYDRIYHSNSPQYRYNNYPAAGQEYNIDAGFGANVAKLAIGYESYSAFYSLAYFRLISSDGEILYEDNMIFSNNGNFTPEVIVQAMRFNTPKIVGDGAVATWNFSSFFYLNGSLQKNKSFYFLGLKQNGKFFGIEMAGDMAKYFNLK